jgi:hypothetical protein
MRKNILRPIFAFFGCGHVVLAIIALFYGLYFNAFLLMLSAFVSAILFVSTPPPESDKSAPNP